MPLHYQSWLISDNVIGTPEQRELPKPDEIILKNVEKRNGLRGVFSPIDRHNTKEILGMFSVLGVEIDRETYLVIEDVISNERLDVERSDNIYIGVSHTDEFTIVSAKIAVGVNNLYIPTSNFNTEEFLRRGNSQIHVCETKEIAREFLTRLNKYGFVSDKGLPLISNNGEFEWNGEDTCYDHTNGKVMRLDTVKDNCLTWNYAQRALYDFGVSLYRYKVPEVGITHENLVRNRLYQLMKTDGENLRPRFFKFNGDITARHGYVDHYEEYNHNGLQLDPTNYKEYFVTITPHNRRVWRAGYNRYLGYMRHREEQDRERYEQERKINLYNIKNNINTYNRDSETQLLSESFHKILTKSLDNKVARCLLKLNKLGYLKCSTRNVTIRRSDKLMTYMPSGKVTEMTEDGAWVAKGRQDGKYGKVIRKLLNEQVPRLKFTDHEIETLVNHIKACASDGNFDIVKGEDIRHWYNGEMYHEDGEETGTLGSSCMRDDNCREYFDIYCNNSNVQMIILKKDKMLVGRAILWDDKWVDRIYGTDSTIKAFKNFCKEKGYHCKSSQNSEPDQGWINPETGESYGEGVVIELETEFNYYPYADTFAYIDVTGGRISNSTNLLSNFCEMRDTCGNLEGGDYEYDEYDDRNIHVDDSVYLEYRGYHTHVDNTTYCDVSGEHYLSSDMVETHDGRMAYEENVVYVDTANSYAESEELFYCEHSEQDYIEGYNRISSVYLGELEMTVADENVEEAYHDNGYTNLEGEWRDTEDLIKEGYVEVNGEWSLSEDEIETV